MSREQISRSDNASTITVPRQLDIDVSVHAAATSGFVLNEPIDHAAASSPLDACESARMDASGIPAPDSALPSATPADAHPPDPSTVVVESSFSPVDTSARARATRPRSGFITPISTSGLFTPVEAPLPDPVTAHPRKRYLATTGTIRHVRNVLAVLVAVCMFGANLAFSALHDDARRTPSAAYIAWAFSAFAVGVVVTLIWQVALVADFRGFAGRLYRSQPVVIGALAAGFASATAGTLLLALSMTFDELKSVRAAGYAVIGVVVVFLCGSLVRLAFTVTRRAARRVKTSGSVATDVADHSTHITASNTPAPARGPSPNSRDTSIQMGNGGSQRDSVRSDGKITEGLLQDILASAQPYYCSTTSLTLYE